MLEKDSLFEGGLFLPPTSPFPQLLSGYFIRPRAFPLGMACIPQSAKSPCRNGTSHKRQLELLNTKWKETSMTATPKESASDREILLVGPYGVLGTGVIDA
ncbi:MAG TPA: hypothetical protein VK638_22130, partial [Edaphobacter sp.]|nr:hypothetical protein [Edaphobacter sp.]